MESPIQEGYLILADISGYTSYLAENEMDHAPAVLHNVLKLLIERLTPTLKLAEVEGDAVFVYASAASISRGELLLELIEDTYCAFRDCQRTMQHNATCPCKACQAISRLDLKFVTHFGSYVMQDITGTQKPVGTCVNLAHRLLKNGVTEATGWHGYALFSEQSLSELGIPLDGMYVTYESFEHLGSSRTGSLNLDEHYRELVEHRRVQLDPADADINITFDFSGPPPIVWDWLNDPHKRNVWASGADWGVLTRPKGRTGLTAQTHCKASGFTEYVLDWHPFSYSTVQLKRGYIDILITDRLELVDGGTHVCRSMRLEGTLPRMLLRMMMKLIAKQFMQLDKAFYTMNWQIAEASEREGLYV